MPYAYFAIYWRLPPIAASAKGATLGTLYSSLLAERLKSVVNDAARAQLSVSVDSGLTG